MSEDPIVRISKIEWDALAEIEMRSALIGRFGRNRPSLEAIKREFRSVLRIEGDMSIGSLDARTILIRFASSDDWRRVIRRNQAKVAGSMVWFSRWTPD